MAYGLQIHGCDDLPGLIAAGLTEPRERPAPAFRMTWDDEDAIAAAWPTSGAARVAHKTWTDGTEFTIDQHPDAGYLIAETGFGRYLLDRHGRSGMAAPPDGVTEAVRSRFVLNQVLPFAAVLQGIEVFHASAVEWGGRAAAFSAGSGVGKSSLAVRSLLLGARFVTEDVLGVTIVDGAPVVHPGPALVSLRIPESDRLDASERERLGTPVPSGEEDRVAFSVESAGRTLPAAVVYFVDRRPGTEALAFREDPDPRLLLASTFNLVLLDADRLGRQLDLCAQLALKAALVRIEIPPSATAADVALAARGDFDHRTA